MENTKIEWCDHTGNIWIGCVEVHEGCDNCYARVLNHRWGKNNWGRDVPRVESKNFFVNLVKFQRDAEKLGEIKTVFVGSMMDIFEKPMPVVDSKGERVYVDTGKQHPIDTGDLREIFFSNITDNKYPNLVFLLLTKRPSNINKYIPESWKTNPPANVWFGTSPVNQETFDKLVPQLYQVQGHRFLSIEPMLNAIDIKKELPTGKGQVAFGLLMDWIIVGGESGEIGRAHV